MEAIELGFIRPGVVELGPVHRLEGLPLADGIARQPDFSETALAERRVEQFVVRGFRDSR